MYTICYVLYRVTLCKSDLKDYESAVVWKIPMFRGFNLGKCLKIVEIFLCVDSHSRSLKYYLYCSE